MTDTAQDEETHAKNAISLARMGRLLERAAGTPLADEYRQQVAGIKLLDSLEPPVPAVDVLLEGFVVTPYELFYFDRNDPIKTRAPIERPLTPEQYEAYLEISGIVE